MEKITQTELGWILCSLDADICRYEQIEKAPDRNPADMAFAHLRREGLQSVYRRLHKAYMDEDKRIAVSDG